MSYSFDSEYSFGYHLKKSIIKETRVMLAEQYGIYEGNVISERDLFAFRQKGQGLPNRDKVRNAIKSLSSRQTEIIFLNYFADVTYDSCRDLMQIAGTTLDRYVLLMKKNLRASLSPEKEEIIRKNVEEKVYRVFQNPIQEKKQ